ncbi:hypothetical protein BV20DRAFT_962437 [Pilatotrama ljubarskyi]|nr:hypothetical protein BV20DRAFT_962437 [Pilatotrama ljubarskyi]
MPSSTGFQDGADKIGRSHDVPLGTIIGSIVGALSLLSILTTAVWCVRRKHRAALDSQPASGGVPASELPDRTERECRSMSIAPLLGRRRGRPAIRDATPPPITFFPEAMVRQGGNDGRALFRPSSCSSTTAEALLGYHTSPPGYLSWDTKSADTPQDVWDEKSVDGERTDLRLQEPIGDSHFPSPLMPLQPLRYETKERTV